MRTPRKLIAIILLCLLPFNLRAEDAKTIKVGSILILSGESSHYGLRAQRAAQMAIDEVNRAGGIRGKQLNFIWEDETSGLAARAVTAYQKLTRLDRVEYIFGPSFQDAMLAIHPLAKKDGLFIVTPSTPSLSLSDVFSTWIDPEQEAKTLAKYVYQHFKRVAVLGGEQSWESMVSVQFQKTFHKLGGEIVFFEEPQVDTPNVKPTVLKAKATNPDAILVSSYILFPKYVKEIRTIGIKTPIFSVEADSGVVEPVKQFAEGIISIGPDIPSTDFTERYQARYGELPDIPAYQAYDAVRIFAKALIDEGEGTDNLRNYFKNFDSYDGVSGVIRRKEGRFEMSSGFFVVRNGKLTKL